MSPLPPSSPSPTNLPTYLPFQPTTQQNTQSIWRSVNELLMKDFIFHLYLPSSQSRSLLKLNLKRHQAKRSQIKLIFYKLCKSYWVEGSSQETLQQKKIQKIKPHQIEHSLRCQKLFGYLTWNANKFVPSIK